MPKEKFGSTYQPTRILKIWYSEDIESDITE